MTSLKSKFFKSNSSCKSAGRGETFYTQRIMDQSNRMEGKFGKEKVGGEEKKREEGGI